MNALEYEGGVRDAVASVLLVRHPRNQAGGAIRPGNADSWEIARSAVYEFTRPNKAFLLA